MEALPQLSLALTLGATLVAFDFAGSGKSGGEHVSLGYYERDDLRVCTTAVVGKNVDSSDDPCCW